MSCRWKVAQTKKENVSSKGNPKLRMKTWKCAKLNRGKLVEAVSGSQYSMTSFCILPVHCFLKDNITIGIIIIRGSYIPNMKRVVGI